MVELKQVYTGCFLNKRYVDREVEDVARVEGREMEAGLVV